MIFHWQTYSIFLQYVELNIILLFMEPSLDENVYSNGFALEIKTFLQFSVFTYWVGISLASRS